jgi:hypothetical protein
MIKDIVAKLWCAATEVAADHPLSVADAFTVPGHDIVVADGSLAG